MTCVIIDDEPLAQELLEQYISKVEGLQLIGKYNSAVEAFAQLSQGKPDLLFLDIQMPRLTGLEFLGSLSNPPLVIVTTAYREYAVESFDLNVLDYLVKPISFSRFLKGVGRAFQHYGRNIPTSLSSLKEESGELIAETLTLSENDFIYIKVDKMMEKVMLQDIVYVESLKNYVRIKTTQKELITYHTLSQMEEKLPVGQFMRVHRSFLVPIHRVEKFSSTEVTVSGKLIPVGGNYKEQFLARMKDFN